MIDIKDNPNRVGTPVEYDREDTRPQFSTLPRERQMEIVNEYLDKLTPSGIIILAGNSVESEESFRNYIAAVIVRRGKNKDFVL